MNIHVVPEFNTRPDKLSTGISGLHLYLRDMSPKRLPVYIAFLGLHLIVNGLRALSHDLDARACPIHKLRFRPPMAASRFSELENDFQRANGHGALGCGLSQKWNCRLRDHIELGMVQGGVPVSLLTSRT
jgi:hypothetical protein